MDSRGSSASDMNTTDSFSHLLNSLSDMKDNISAALHEIGAQENGKVDLRSHAAQTAIGDALQKNADGQVSAKKLDDLKEFITAALIECGAGNIPAMQGTLMGIGRASLQQLLPPDSGSPGSKSGSADDDWFQSESDDDLPDASKDKDAPQAGGSAARGDHTRNPQTAAGKVAAAAIGRQAAAAGAAPANPQQGPAPAREKRKAASKATPANPQQGPAPAREKRAAAPQAAAADSQQAAAGAVRIRGSRANRHSGGDGIHRKPAKAYQKEMEGLRASERRKIEALQEDLVIFSMIRPIARLFHEIVQVELGKISIRVQKTCLYMLATSVVHFSASLFNNANVLALSARRVTVMQQDFKHLRQMDWKVGIALDQIFNQQSQGDKDRYTAPRFFYDKDLMKIEISNAKKDPTRRRKPRNPKRNAAAAANQGDGGGAPGPVASAAPAGSGGAGRRAAASARNAAQAPAKKSSAFGGFLNGLG